ncbi:MAG: peroxiredoxin family protein [Fidelibacterota bacterium]
MNRLITIISIFILVISTGCSPNNDKGSVKDSTANVTPTNQPARPKNAVLAPGFSLARTSGEIVSMDDLKGKVILLNFWGTWCGPCRKEIPDFVKLYEKYHKDGLEIIGVTLTSGSPDKIETFMSQWKMNYTILTDIGNNETQQVTADYGRAVGQPITGIPTTFLIDRDGYIVKSYLGPRSEEIFYHDLKPYL